MHVSGNNDGSFTTYNLVHRRHRGDPCPNGPTTADRQSGGDRLHEAEKTGQDALPRV